MKKSFRGNPYYNTRAGNFSKLVPSSQKLLSLRKKDRLKAEADSGAGILGLSLPPGPVKYMVFWGFSGPNWREKNYAPCMEKFLKTPLIWRQTAFSDSRGHKKSCERLIYKIEKYILDSKFCLPDPGCICSPTLLGIKMLTNFIQVSTNRL